VRLVGRPVDFEITFSYVGCPSGCVLGEVKEPSKLVIPEGNSNLTNT
jgi:hypothetical protein